MASKKRGGLSKREYAAAQLVRKPAIKSVARKTDYSGVENLTGLNRQAARNAGQSSVYAGPSLPGKVAPGFYDYSTMTPKPPTQATQREQAARGQKNKLNVNRAFQSGGLTTTPNVSLFGIPTAQASERPDYSTASLQTTMNVPKGAGGNVFNKASDWLRQSAPMGVGNLLQTLNQRGVDLSALSGTDELFGLKEPGLAEYRTADNQYIADQQGMADFGRIKEQDPTADANDYMQKRENQEKQWESGNLAPWANSAPPRVLGATDNNGDGNTDTGDNNKKRKNNFDPSFMEGGEGDVNNTYYQNPRNLDNSPNTPDNGNNDVSAPPYDQAPAGVTNQMRGSGLFGTGKGVGNPAGDDPYIKELRKAYASNGGEKWLRKQFEELINALDPTYAQYQKEGTDALNQQLWENNTRLASVMNANNTGDSEQRAQLMAGQQRDTNTALGNLLAKLALNKSQDISGYKSKMAEGMSQLKERNQTNRQKLMEQIQQYRNDQFDQQYKTASLRKKDGNAKAGSITFLGNDTNGNPVYYNTTTGQKQAYPGIKRPNSDPFAGLFSGGQGGSWETDPITGQQIWVTD